MLKHNEETISSYQWFDQTSLIIANNKGQLLKVKIACNSFVNNTSNFIIKTSSNILNRKDYNLLTKEVINKSLDKKEEDLYKIDIKIVCNYIPWISSGDQIYPEQSFIHHKHHNIKMNQAKKQGCLVLSILNSKNFIIVATKDQHLIFFNKVTFIPCLAYNVSSNIRYMSWLLDYENIIAYTIHNELLCFKLLGSFIQPSNSYGELNTILTSNINIPSNRKIMNRAIFTGSALLARNVYKHRNKLTSSSLLNRKKRSSFSINAVSSSFNPRTVSKRSSFNRSQNSTPLISQRRLSNIDDILLDSNNNNRRSRRLSSIDNVKRNSISIKKEIV